MATPKKVSKNPIQVANQIKKYLAIQKEEESALSAKASELKIKYNCKDVFLLEVEGKIAWLRSVDRKVISMASTLGGEDAVRVVELILDACWLEGDDCIRDDDDYFIGAMKQVQGLMVTKTSTLKKL